MDTPLKDQLRQFICDAAFMEEDEVNNQTPLFSGGIMDSLTLLELISFVEKQFAIKVSPSKVSLENFDTIDRIFAFVAEETRS